MKGPIVANVHPLVRVGTAAHFQLRNRVWHRTEQYPSRCTCGIDPLTADAIKPSLDDTWRYTTEDHQAACITKLLRIELDPAPGTRGGLEIGMRVAIDEDAAHLYEPGGGGEWYLEAFGKRDDDGAPIARLRDKITEVYVWAPLHWISPWSTVKP